MNSKHVVFNKSQDVVFMDNTDVMFRKMESLGIKEIKGTDKKKFIMANIMPCTKVLAPA